MTCGIYQIRNIENNKKYIGYSNDIERRWKYHLSYLRRDKHENGYLQGSWNKHGEENFVFEIVEICKEKVLIKREKYYIKVLDTFRPNGYNLSKGGLGNTGWIPSQETLEKKSISASGNKNPMWGRKHSEKTKILFSQQRQGTKNGVGNKNNLGKIKKYKNSTSKFYGVFKRTYKYKGKERITWRARFCENGTDIRLGAYVLETDAAKAFDEKCWGVYHDLSKLNFPENYS